ncbi:MAG: hypothetical protein IJ976_02875 [Alistipes sp.]|nr:hypothetical protein [Alistipes sp.]MBR3775076.1 hypothetical protein [Alistipes sp.]
MRRVVLLSLLLLVFVGDVVAQRKAKWERRIERAQEQDKSELNRIWRKRSDYLNLAFVVQNVETNIDELSELNSEWGASISWGKTFYLHRKPIGRVLKFGLDWTWLDLNGACFEQDMYSIFDGDYHETLYQLDAGMQFGPSITVNPVNHLKISTYFRVTPTFATVYAVENELFLKNYATYLNAGLSVAWRLLSLGVEYRTGKTSYDDLGELSELMPGVAIDLNTTSWRMYFGFRF